VGSVWILASRGDIATRYDGEVRAAC
jgi:hypothetical protein